MRVKWDKNNIELLIRLKFKDNKSWQEVAEQIGTTEIAIRRKYNYLQNDGLIPYCSSFCRSNEDEIFGYYKEHGHRATIDKYGSYSVKYLQKAGLWKRVLPIVEVKEDDFLQSKQKFYWAGFIAADGCIRSKSRFDIYLSKKDKEHLLKLHKLLGGSIYEYEKSACINVSKVRKIIAFFKSLNITERKSLTLCSPIIKKENDIRRFIRGLFDGDGSVSCCIEKSKYFRQYANFLGTKKMMCWVRNCIKKFCGTKTFPSVCSTKSVFSLKYSSRHDFLCLYEWLYKDSSIYLKRKKNKFDCIESFINQKQDDAKYFD